MAESENLESLRLLKRTQVESLTGLSRASIYAEMLAERFPRPFRTGGRGVGWRQGEIAEWLASRERSTGWQGGE